MGKTKKRKNSQYRYRSSQGVAGPRMIVGAVLVLLALIGGFYLLRKDPPQLAASTETVTYDPADVVYDEGLVGVHEMESSQAPPPARLPAGGPQPSLEIPQDEWSFGNIGPKDVVDHTYVLKNTGDAPLTISRIYTTCSCTRGELTARVIPPGKTALLRMVFDAGFHDTRGQQVRRGVIVESNDPAKSDASVWAEASVGW